MEFQTLPGLRLTWSLAEISEHTGLSVGFLRAEVRARRLPVRRFGRRVLVKNDDLQAYLDHGSERPKGQTDNDEKRQPACARSIADLKKGS
jgi:excisionase family DNA binding protein